MRSKKRLGEMMTETGLVSNEQLSEALADQWQYGGRLGTILVDKCVIDEKTLLRALSEQLKVPAITFLGRTIPESVMRLLSRELAWKYLVVPVELKTLNGRKTLVLGMADPTDSFAIGVVEKMTGYPVVPMLAFDNTIRMVLMEFYETQYGRGDLTLRRRSEPDECEPEKIAVGARENQPTDVSVYLGGHPAGEETFTGAPARAEAETSAEERARVRERLMPKEADNLPERLSPELQAMLQLLVRKGMFKPGEYAGELRKLKMGAG